MRSSTFVFLLLAAISGVLTGYDATSQKNVAVYWGQNSRGARQPLFKQANLKAYCADDSIDIFMIAFLVQFKGPGDQPVLNLANYLGDENCPLFQGTGLGNCAKLGEEINYCQKEKNKTVLLSIGGSGLTENIFDSEDEAKTYAAKIWHMFGPVNEGSGALRPFGNAIVDGFDLDIESPANHSDHFADELRGLMAEPKDKYYYLTAAPQCPLNSANGPPQDFISKIKFDMVFVQFYNNECGVHKNSYNIANWTQWASKSGNPEVRIFMGVPGDHNATEPPDQGYLPPDELKGKINQSKANPNFAGAMIWDASQAFNNTAAGNYANAVKGKLSET